MELLECSYAVYMWGFIVKGKKIVGVYVYAVQRMVCGNKTELSSCLYCGASILLFYYLHKYRRRS